MASKKTTLKAKKTKKTTAQPKVKAKSKDLEVKATVKASTAKKTVEKKTTTPAKDQSAANKASTKKKVAEEKTNPKKILNTEQIVSLVVGILAITAFAFYSFYTIPNQILTETIQARLERENKEKEAEINRLQAELDVLLEQENETLNFESNKSWDIDMVYKDFGTLKVTLKEDYAPKTVENFIRLVYRDYYNNTVTHRIVEDDTFSVIQGGDAENKDGTGGRSAFYLNEDEQGLIPDELWEVEPEFDQKDGVNVLNNEPKFRYPDLYGKLNADEGTVEYKKGLILMAKTAAPNSASSQFFITLTDTVLPAQYTVFGVVAKDSLSILDKISREVDPVAREGQELPEGEKATDGTPSKEVLLEEVQIVRPRIEN